MRGADLFVWLCVDFVFVWKPSLIFLAFGSRAVSCTITLVYSADGAGVLCLCVLIINPHNSNEHFE